MSAAGRVAAITIVVLAALQVAWHGWLSPPAESQRWAVVLFFVAPLLPALGLLVARHRRAAFWGAQAAVLDFCDRIMGAWAMPAAPPPQNPERVYK